MIAPGDRVVLPHGVELHAGELHDPVRLSSVPVNATGAAVLATATPAEGAAALARSTGVDAEVALRDVLRFCAELNARALLNVAPRGGGAAIAWRWLRHVPFLLPLGLVPRLPSVRRPVDTSDVLALARTGSAALARFAVTLLAVAIVSCSVLLAALGTPAPALAAILGVAVAASVAVHELAHLAALRGVPACVVTRGLRIAIVHRATSSSRTVAVAAAGPAAGLALGAALVGAVALRPSAEAGAAALVALWNAVGLTVLSRDGRTLCGLR